MARYSDADLKPRNSHTLEVGIIARISGCASQNELSLDDQIDNSKDFVDYLYKGPVKYEVIATKGKGEQLDRPELQDIEELLRSRKLDLFLMEDVGRLVRGSEAVRLWGIAVDHGTRCIAPHDSCDTADLNWEEAVMQACASHVAHNAHTSKRIKHKTMNRFKKSGASVALLIAGYEKPPGAETYADWIRIDDLTEKVRKGLHLLKATGNCSAVADCFNEVNFPLGPYARNAKWDGRMVRRYYQNSLLAGKPGRGFRTTIKHHESGRRISVKNTTSEPVFLDYPHLAHVSFEELEAVNCLIAEQNSNFSRRRPNGVDQLARKQKKRTRFPGQHARCWYCGRRYVWGGNGVAENLMCNGSRDWLCWHSISFKGALAAERLVEVITTALGSLDGVDDQFAALVELSSLQGDLSERRARLEDRRSLIAQQRINLVNAIAALGLDDSMQAKKVELETERITVSQELAELDALERQGLKLPQSAADLRNPLEQEFKRLTRESWQFGDLMRQIVPEIHVYAVRLVGDSRLLPRAQVKLSLAGQLQGAASCPQLKKLTESTVTVDLFDRPRHEVILNDVLCLAAEKLSPGAIAARLGQGVGARHVNKALELKQKMIDLGLEDPYVLVSEPPDDLKKIKRHRNPRYCFTPLQGHEPPNLG